VEDISAEMSVTWTDFNNDGLQEILVANGFLTQSDTGGL
jgi:hypothetical protein